jgi:flagellar basal body-associated protein FliL
VAEAEAKRETPEQGEAPKKKSPVMLIGIIAVVMVVEAVGVYFVVSALSHKPESAGAKQIAGAHSGGGEEGGDHGSGSDHSDAEAPVELKLVEDKFQNMSAGKAWLWDAALFLQVKNKHANFVKERLKAREAEIKEGVAMIFRKATLNQLKEPGLETVNRQVAAFVNKVVEADADGKSRVERVLIPKCRGFATD